MKRLLVRAALVLGVPFVLYSCYDDFERITAGDVITEDTRNAPISVDNPSALVQQKDGTWKAENARVPLVGVGRVVNQVSKGTVSVVSGTGDLGAIVDLDLKNSYKVGGLVGADLGTADAIAVRDIYRTYSANQKVGFVIDPGSGSLLSLDVLSGSVISFYLNDNCVGKVTVNKDDTGGIGLDLLGVSSGENTEQTLIVKAPCIFDEVRLKFGDAVDVLSESVGIKYAFVGDNSDEIAIKGLTPDFKGVVNHSWNIKDAEYLTDGDITNCTNIYLGNLTIGWDNNVDLRGYEVGFVYETYGLSLGDLINIAGLLDSAPKLYALDSSGETLQSLGKDKWSLISLDVLNHNNTKVSMIVKEDLKKAVTELKIASPTSVLSSINVYYAYIRKPVTIDNSSYFAFPEATIYTDTYQLPVAQQEHSSVTYTVLSWPNACENEPTVVDGKLTGATANGAYVIQAVYTNKDGVGVSYTSTIYRESRVSTASGCNTYITTTSYGAYPTETLDSWNGSLISILSGLKNPDAVVDDNYNNYATRSGIDVVKSTAIYAMKTTRMVNAGNSSVRAGFIIEPNLGLLDVKLLKNYEVRLYNGNTRVDEGATSSGENSKVLGLDLIGDGNGRLRVYVETDKAFNRLELWSKGLADVSLFSQLRIYGAFFEDTYCSTSFAQDLCMEVMNNSNYGVDLDYSVFNSSSLVGLKENIDGLGYLIDNDLDTGVKIGGLLKIGSISLGLKFNDMPASQPIGIVLDGMEGLANVNALSGITMTVYHDNDAEVEKKTSFDLLDLDLINKTGKLYLEMTPTKLEMTPTKVYNKLKITLEGVNVSLAGTPRITGIYTRKDSDGDGIPDCVTDPDVSDDGGFTFSEGETCYPNDLVLKATGSYQEGQEYLFECTNSQTKEVFQKQVAVNSNKEIVLSGLSAGLYSIAVHSPLTGVIMYNQVAYVYPELTEWKGLSTDWNDWDNWTDGKPSGCTNVILRKGVPYYPVLTGESACANIHFEEGSYIQHINYLKYKLAFVDMLVKGGNYRMITVPLRETCSGDFFVNTGVSWTKDKYFDELNDKNYPEKRVSPIVYQRIWKTEKDSVWQILEDGDTQQVAVNELSGWTEDFNYLNYEHVPGMGFSLKAGEDGESASYRFRFPKSYTEYNYYYSDGKPVTDRKEEVTRSTNFIGKLVTDSEYKLTVKTSSNVSRNEWAVGNPFMSVLSIEGFFKDNPWVKKIILNDDDDDIIYYTSDKISNVQSGGRKFLNPAEGFIISTSESSGSGEYEVTFRADHVYPMTAVATRSSRSANNGRHALFLEAQGGESISYAAVWSFSGADNGVNEMEDAVMMTDRKNRRAVEVFTIADNKALAIQCMNNLNRIPVGLMVDGSKDVTLKIQTDDAKWRGWELVDTLTGKRYRLNNGEVKIRLGIIKTTLSRLYLQKL